MGPADQVVLALHGDLATLADTYLLRMCHYVCLGRSLSVCTADKVQREVSPNGFKQKQKTPLFRQ